MLLIETRNVHLNDSSEVSRLAHIGASLDVLNGSSYTVLGAVPTISAGNNTLSSLAGVAGHNDI